MENKGNYRQTIGRLGEDMVCRHLEGLGHRILERNWRSGHLEIDIITVDQEGIHFVEVKTRRKNIQAPPQENVGRTKQKRITTAALRYLNSQNGFVHKDMECFFDVAAVTFEGEAADVEWIPNAYIPLYI